MPAFPSYGKLAFEGFQRDRASAMRRSQMESGPPKQLKTVSRVMIDIPVTYHLNSLTDYNNFITWFQDTINYGADWFDWTDPVDSSGKSARIKDGKIKEIPRRKALDRWRISFTLETWSA